MSPSTRSHTYLVIGGALSGYTFALFRTIHERFGIETRFIHAPREQSAAFAHESFSDDRFRELRWKEASVRDIDRFIRHARPEVVLLYGTEARVPMLTALARVPRTTPFVFASDANIVSLAGDPKLLARKLAYSLLFRRADAALSLGHTNAAALRLLGARRLLDVPVYAIDYAELDRAAAHGVAGGRLRESSKRTLVVVARLVDVKNHAAALEAVGADPTQRRAIRLVFVGDGPERAALEAQARTYPELEVDFVGAVPRAEVGGYFRRADALLLPSIHEPWGIVVCEALGLGVPVIASPNVGAAVSLAGHTRGILLARSCHANHLAEALHAFVTQHDVLREGARVSAAAVRKQFSMPDVAGRLVTELEGLAGRVPAMGRKV